MTPLEIALHNMDRYLEDFANTTDDGMKAIYLSKAAYWSIEADIERYWEEYGNQRLREMEQRRPE